MELRGFLNMQKQFIKNMCMYGRLCLILIFMFVFYFKFPITILCVQICDETTLISNNGVLQGCVMSPFFILLYQERRTTVVV